MGRLFSNLDEDDEGAISKEDFHSFIHCYLKVTKETVITTEMVLKDSKPIRRVEENEVCEVLEGPLKEESVDVLRLQVRCLKDNIDGWITPVGNQGTVFLEEPEGGILMKVVK